MDGNNWLRLQDTRGWGVYVNMEAAHNITFDPSSTLARVVFEDSEWVSTANEDDIATLHNWLDHHAGNWTVPREMNLRAEFPEVFEVKA